MRATAGPVHDPTPTVPTITIPRATVAHWAEVIAFAIDNPPECLDALLELAADVEAACERAA